MPFRQAVGQPIPVPQGVFERYIGFDGVLNLMKGEGELGTSLFAAASGMRGLVDLGRRLEDEASVIFAPRAAKDRRFYQALGRFDEARKAIHDRELRAGDWKALNERIDELCGRLEEIKALRGAKAAQGHVPGDGVARR